MESTYEQTLTILHTNDIHSRFGSMPSLAAMAAEQKRACEGVMLLLDIGDHMDRMASETEGTFGGANVDVINLTGYDAVTIGNNEGLTFTPEMLEQAYAGIQCPVVCGNIRETATGAPPAWMMESLVLNKEGIRIGLVAATAPFATFYRLLGWEARDPIESLKEQVAEIRGTVDVVIVMSHLGLHTDERLVKEIEGIDVILGGHTHHVLETPLMIGGTALCAAGKHGMLLGKVVLARSGEDKAFRVITGECLPLDSTILDERVAAAIAVHRQQAEIRLQETVAFADRACSIAYERESEFGNLMAQAVRHFTGAQLAIVNSGQLLGPLPEGSISKGLLHQLCPSPINACTVSLKGSAIRLALEQSLLPEFADKKIIGFGFRGEVLGSLCVDGIQIIYDLLRNPYDRIIEIWLGGELLVDEEIYNVGTLDMFTFKIGYESLASGTEPEYRLPEFLRDLIGIELQRPNALQESMASRWITVHE
ncbi:bifunctional metallophosphatase/5'-nucleotidase [Paenibacillus sp. P96]|uniref:Bifunctional metallophosphatase/5'-nucleotidase n=1 Tax=Paenibacillus zeirhizosphaerae TaxID=2987519 RepID=A0ABT9FTH7_9BACL|nr:bifunctional UDP-sugar hydrolase/5'-nucleotidase [Paenibacillus sp. P96]MDP4097925.1 bifunctional metallophosphatase/5'-nucleotidase [Paenibacillus sp. P96]